MRTIAFGLQKGGVGKTSISLAAACELAKSAKVMLVDADPQGNSSAAAACGAIKSELADVLFENCFLEDAIVQSPLASGGLFILPTKPIGQKDRESLLRTYKKNRAVEEPFVFDDICKSLAKSFDFCIFDTSPDFSIFEENVFFACDEIVPVMNCDKFSADGLAIFMKNIREFSRRKRVEPEIRTLVLNNYNASFLLDTNIKNAIVSTDEYEKILVPQDQAFKRSQAHRIPVQAATKKKATLQALSDLAAALARGKK